MQKIIFSIVLLLLGSNLFSQQLYMPRNIQQAYENGTRSTDGNPGKNYWQNKGKYEVNITFTPQTRMVNGFEKIAYSNNSRDTLKTIAIRFVNNMHKPVAPRARIVNEDYLSEGMKISLLKIDGEVYEVHDNEWGTVYELDLKKSIMPKSQSFLEIEWSYPLSKESSREGQIDSTSFFVGYSYPRVSVYDDYNGWDLIDHTGLQEFYNDFNDYQFSVKVPKNYIVWSTGNFLNPEEVLQPKIADRYRRSLKADEVIHIATHEEMNSGLVTQQKDWNTWKFAFDHIPDFTFAVSNHYVWDAGSTVVDKITGRRASMQAAYANTATDFQNSVDWGKNTMQYFSQILPGIPYPYPVMTAFQGYGDMEFPMMVNDETVPHNLLSARMLQDHEMAHTYFPFYMGINETRYAFMDEGWAVFFTYFLSRELFGEKTGDDILSNSRIGRWNRDFSSEMDMPMITMSSQLSGKAYRNNSYNKSVASYVALKDLLGYDLFKKALHHYMNIWNGKHPIPWDFFNAMNAGSGKNLNWFWENWFFSNKYMDLQISNVKNEKKDFSLDIVNKGGLYIPAKIIAYYSNGTTVVKEIKVDDWNSNKSTHKKISFPQKSNANINKIEINNGVFVDATPQDNVWIRK